MKPSEMTNEELAKELDDVLVNDELQAFADVEHQQEVKREAAARLRRPTPVDDDLLKMARDIDKLRAKLRVAKDALTELQTRFVASVHDGTIDPYEALKIVEDALSAIRKEGGNDAH